MSRIARRANQLGRIHRELFDWYASHAAQTAIWNNCILYIFPARKFSHSLDPKRTLLRFENYRIKG
jgi:hypothetical protein